MSDSNTTPEPLGQPQEQQYEDGQIVGRHHPMLSNSVYDGLKFIALVMLPALGTLYFALAQIWGLPAADEVVGTIVSVDTFLGLLLGVSGKSYKEATEGPTIGILRTQEDPTGKVQASLEFPGDPADVVNHDKVTFKVINEAPE